MQGPKRFVCQVIRSESGEGWQFDEHSFHGITIRKLRCTIKSPPLLRLIVSGGTAQRLHFRLRLAAALPQVPLHLIGKPRVRRGAGEQADADRLSAVSAEQPLSTHAA